MNSNKSISQATDNQFNAGQRGIELVNTIGTSSSCCNNVVEDNTISSVNPGNTLGTLLFASMNAGPTSPRITCNILKDAMKGFVFSGPNPGTYWRGNKMEDLDIGMELRDAGVIGVQGSSVAPSDNEWNGSWPAATFGTFVGQGSTALSSPLYVQSGLPYEPPNYGGSVAQPNWFNAFGGTLTATGAYVCGGGPNQIVLPLPQEEEYENPNDFYIANTTLYRMLYLNPGIRGAGTDLETWFDNIDLGNAELFMQIEENLSAGELSAAQSLINDISPVNAVEENYKSYYGLYIHYADEDFEFSSEDSTALFELASLCPTTDGACVYQARALLNMLGNKPFYGFFDCETDAGFRKRNHSLPEPTDKGNWELKIFPSPAFNYVILRTNRTSEQLNVRIMDVSGRIVYESAAIVRNYETSIDKLNIPAGIYFIEVVSDSGDRSFRKLIIQH